MLSSKNFDHLHRLATLQKHYTLTQSRASSRRLTSQRRDLSLTQPLEPPTLKVQEAQIKDAILQYHQTTIVPNHSLLIQACKQDYSNPVLKQYYTQIQIDTIDSRLKALEFHSHLLECALLVIPY